MTEQRTYGDRVGIVTVTYFAGDTLEKFLDTLEKATERDVHVVVADNASTDGAPERAAERENVTLVSIGENVGYGTAANRGAAALDDSYGWIVVVNPDLEWEPGALDALLEVAGRWPRGGAFGPLIHDLDGTVYPSARLLPSFGRGIGHAAFGKIWPGNPWTREYRQENAAPAERVSGWLSGSCQLLRREAFDSVGGFDPRYFMYFEDVDLGDRLAKAGWLNVYAPSAGVMHIGGHSTAQASAKMLRAHHASAYRYLADRHRGLRWKPVLAAVKLGLALRVKLETRRG
ncbi:N-acetylglucosaminyl-diphospho-decaprenol L-rhamnosyltransferase [Amycolatopsis sulphurea]|uniref:N-acetylglucosaminyl-diphospho-decaprenol L-rhamnosyltransferase n=1 Tax=Amycolatopsis sulphurea TaxID=76022 RepID=A0A2A9F7Q4_9PSEU|nr:glycosyltransferase family 2 protein [Amycolatopsis sulphurea]PFG47364.1 N-acetylglucosaminyl-diphospho-decaprenol L-rhamnosyltransferase [Amycolatopsis sulphurea]